MSSVSQLMSDMRQLVVGLQQRERVTDLVLSKSQTIYDKVSRMKEYQEDGASNSFSEAGNDPVGHSVGLQQENRQIVQLMQENRELLQTIEDCENTIEIIMRKHRLLMSKFPITLSAVITKLKNMEDGTNDQEKKEKLVEFTRAMSAIFSDGERISNQNQEEIARLKTENACLREMLNICEEYKPGIMRNFYNRTDPFGKSSMNEVIPANEDEPSDDDGASTPTSASQSDWAENSLGRNCPLVERSSHKSEKSSSTKRIDELSSHV
ncbi:hypothetical protein AB6A40_002666 [Gnathostoma spinigerum]|uniref:Uncharacterized protein n=1 Tax=Gnathostoma spinigerum TaxID=75299 RepID=A0ABD6E9H7_9BILA